MENTKTKTLLIILIALVVGLCLGNISGKMGYSMRNRGGSCGMDMMKDKGMMMGGEQMHGAMKGMMMGLEGKTGDALDKAFLEEMVIHHQGAIDMSEMMLKESKRPELIKLGNEIISAQTKEIDMMNGWLKSWYKN